MSFDALAWAAKVRTKHSTDKLVLLGLAECASREKGEAHPSIAALCEFGSLNRKTVIASLDRLEAAGLIRDTGEHVGRTGQVKVYQLSLSNNTENGTLKESQKRDRSQKRNSSDFTRKESQKRDTEPVKEPVISKEASASSDKRATDRLRYHRLPQGWAPTRPLPPKLQAKVDQWPPGMLDDQLESMRRWATNAKDEAGKGRKLDWDTAFHNWLDRHDADRPRQSNPHQAGIGRTVAAAQSVIADIRAARARTG